MIKVKIIALGRLKESYLRSAAEEYSKRLSRYCSLEIVEINPKNLPDNPNEALIAAALEGEAEMILKAIPQGSRVVAMCIEGKQLSSEQLSESLKGVAMETGSITFIIGSSYGLSDRVKSMASERMSMSRMTFPHQLARIMLLEQIYRGFKIGEGSAYHK